MDLGLKGKVAFVAAASKGMGKACALGLAAEGARVLMCARGEAGLKDAAAEVKQKTGAEVLAVARRSLPRGGLRAGGGARARGLGGVDVLVGNVGGPPPGPFEKMTDAQWIQAFEQVHLSTVRLIRDVLPGMKAKKWGRILAIQSTSVKQPVDGLVLSNGIRPGVAGLFKTLAVELAKDGITVNLVLPGRIMTDRFLDHQKERAESGGPHAGSADRAVRDGHPHGPCRHPGGIRQHGGLPGLGARLLRDGHRGAGGRGTHPEQRLGRWFVAFWHALKGFRRDTGLFLAAGLAFYFLVCLVPMLFLFVSISGYLLSSEAATSAILSQLSQIVPVYKKELSDTLSRMIAARQMSGVLGSVILLFFSIQLFACLRMVMNVVFEERKGRGFFRGMVLGRGDADGDRRPLRRQHVHHRPLLLAAHLRARAGPSAATVGALDVPGPRGGFSTGLYFVVYRYFPTRRPRFGAALAGALLASILWEAAKQLFRWYILSLGVYDQIYGPARLPGRPDHVRLLLRDRHGAGGRVRGRSGSALAPGPLPLIG
jgi:3-oxoacyl-[acyl-carrier protein] reductase